MTGITIWRVGGSSECVLAHSTAGIPRQCGSGNAFIGMSGNGFGENADSFISTLSGTATRGLDGTLVECFGPAFSREAGNMIGNGALQILG